MLAAALLATFLVLPDPIRAGFVYIFAGCGYVPDSMVYFAAYEAGEHYQEFVYGTPTTPAGCFRTPDAVWIWGPGAFTVEVWQARSGHFKLHRILAADVSVVPAE